MDADDKRRICRDALDLPSGLFESWQMGFIHAVVYGSAGISEEQYKRIEEKVNGIIRLRSNHDEDGEAPKKDPR